MKKRLAVAFTGPSDSGKTTLIVKISTILINEYKKKVAIIKSDPKNKASFDTKGKDSFKFSQTGANVVVTSSKKTTFFFNEYKNLEEIIETLGNFEILLVEGLKTLPLPRIAVFKDQIDIDYLDVSQAVAVSNDIEKRDISSNNLPLLNINDPKEVISWILINAKEV